MLAAALAAPPRAAADESVLRIATWNAALTRKGPGLLLRDLERGAEDLAAPVAAIAALDPDILLLTDLDYDLEGRALAALAGRLAAAGAAYPHRFALRPNTGMATGRDLDGDGRRGQPRDAQGYGWFAGEGGLALLSRLAVEPEAVRDLSDLLWADLPGSLIAPDDPGHDIQRLSSTAHWLVPLRAAEGGRLWLGAFHATPPVFDGPEDRNGRRNHDEVALWQRLLDGALGDPPPPPPLVILGNANLDPERGAGRRGAIRALLDDPRLQDPLPGAATVDWGGGTGEMRVSYVLPSADLAVRGAGIAPPVPGQRHRLVWVDLAWPSAAEGPDS
ncbi:endonuclease/exonuclease/phosphatase family protein [Roseivivax sp. CAU 1761]